uniref:non-ribosomal peptide synthetase n=1 Tax=uncultured Roseibium sp. TaxID=1936171 RepID=UPI0032176008
NAMFSKELISLYAGENLPPVDMQYVDFVHWEQAWLASDACRAQIDFWRDRIDADDPPLALPLDHPRPAVMSHDGAMVGRTLSADLTARLRAFARTERVSLFHLLVSALMVLLYRITGDETISIGTSAANRNTRAFQDVMGLFVNTLVLRAPVSGATSLRAFLHATGETCKQALLRQELPFEKLTSERAPRRDLGVHPLFQVMFVHQNVPSLYGPAGMGLAPVKLDYGATKFDLNLWAEEIGDELVLSLFYARNLFERSSVERMLDHYEGVLGGLLDQPDEMIGRLGFFAPEPDLPAPVPQSGGEESFVSRFERQVALAPDAAAVRDARQTLSYDGLNRAANRLAARLGSLGAAPDVPVALMVSRNADMVIGVLGVMKAGAPYLPLDPGLPEERLATLLADAGVRVIVTDAAHDDRIGALGVGEIVGLDSIDGENDANPPVPPGLRDAAYIIYTSGTTGVPKGVCVEHRQLMSYVDAIWPRMGLGVGDSFATVSPLSADLGNTMIFPPLANGGCVTVIAEELVTDAAGFAAQMAAHPVDCLKIVPSHLGALIEAGDVLPRKLLVLGGEAASGGLIAAIRARRPDLRILNHYGPTETTIGVLTHELPIPCAGETPPLGKPLAGARVFVLDRDGNHVPRGIPGEIFIGGASVARGYWNRPDLTAERFVPDPELPGGRLYRTGDRGRVDDGGILVFEGRVDRQIKLRGHRVEPAEIEAALERHEAVAQAVVQLDSRGRIVAHVRTIAPVEIRMLADALRAQLPAHMVPATITRVASMPLTANGKLNARALLNGTEGDAALPGRAPRDEIELALTRIWKDMLGLETLGIDDDFFALGGHSLLAVQLMSRIGRRFGHNLPLASLFEHNTIARLAPLLRSGAPAGFSPLVTIQSAGDAPGVVFVHPAGGNVLCFYDLAEALGRDRPFFALQADLDEPDHAVPDIARRYLAALPPEPPALIGGWSMGALIGFEIAARYADLYGVAPPVAVLDQLAPVSGLPVAEEADDLTLMLSYAKKVAELVGQKDIGLDPQALRAATPAEQTELFLDSFVRHGLAPDGTTSAQFRRYLDLMLAHNRTTQAYRPSAPYAGRIIVFRAEEALDPIQAAARPRDLGWQRFSLQKVTVVPVPGNHVSIMRKPNVTLLAQNLLTELSATAAS